MAPANLKYAKTHEWLSLNGDVGTIGISDFAVKELTDLVYMGLPNVGKKLTAGEVFGEIESVKAVSDVYAPVTGEVIAVNEALPDNLAMLSESPFEKAWIAKLRMTDPSQVSQLLAYSDYQKHCEKDVQ